MFSHYKYISEVKTMQERRLFKLKDNDGRKRWPDPTLIMHECKLEMKTSFLNYFKNTKLT